MDFSFDRFYRMNRRAIIWLVLFALIYLMRDFFAVIFLTYITGFFALPAAQFLMRRLGLGRLFAISLVYLGILFSFGAVVWIVAPSLVAQVNNLQKRLPEIQQNIENLHARFSDEEAYPNVSGFVNTYLPREAIDETVADYKQRIRDYVPKVSGQLVRFGAAMLLAILFSCLIIVDYFRLANQVKSLRSSKLRDFYEEAGQPVVDFALALGRGLQAIVVTAFIATLLAAIGMAAFGMGSLVLLSVIVFLTSLVPVVGVALAIVPVGLVALDQLGADRTIGVIIMLAAVHAVMAYLIGPMIFGRRMRLNPVLVLIILFLSQRLFGVWGLILGVPVANYFIREVFKVPIIDEERAAAPPGSLTMKPAEAGDAQSGGAKPEPGAGAPNPGGSRAAPRPELKPLD